MNYIKATISKIQTQDNISILSFKTQTQVLKMMALELDDKVQIGAHVILGAKASNIALAQRLEGDISISNQLKCEVKEMQLGTLLCSVKLEFEGTILESIITKDSAIRMKIEKGSHLMALIKSSELSIMEVL